jgi:integrase
MAYADRDQDGKLNGWWWGEVDRRYKGGSRFRHRFETKAQADGYEAYIKATGEEPPGLTGKDVGGRTFAAVAQELKDAGGPDGVWKRGKDKALEQRFEYVCRSRLGQLPVTQVDYATGERLVDELRKRPGPQGKPKTEATINRYMDVVSVVLSYAERKGYIARRPQLPRQKEPKRKQPTYKPYQVEALIAWLKPQHHTVALCVTVLASTGLRVGELLGLKREQIEDDFIVLDDPEQIKNEEPRELYLDPELARELRAVIVAGLLPSYVLIDKWVRKGNLAVGNFINRPIHALRAFAASRIVGAAGDVQIAKELLGHRNINTTLRYRHIDRETKRERAKNLSPVGGESKGEVVELKISTKLTD